MAPMHLEERDSLKAGTTATSEQINEVQENANASVLTTAIAPVKDSIAQATALSLNAEEKPTLITGEFIHEIGRIYYKKYELGKLSNENSNNISDDHHQETYVRANNASDVFLRDLKNRLKSTQAFSELISHYIALELASHERYLKKIRTALSPDQYQKTHQLYKDAYDEFIAHVLAAAQKLNSGALPPSLGDQTLLSISVEAPGLWKDEVAFEILRAIGITYRHILSPVRVSGKNYVHRMPIRWDRMPRLVIEKKQNRLEGLFNKTIDELCNEITKQKFPLCFLDEKELELLLSTSRSQVLSHCSRGKFGDSLEVNEFTRMREEFKKSLDIVSDKLRKLLRERKTSGGNQATLQPSTIASVHPADQTSPNETAPIDDKETKREELSEKIATDPVEMENRIKATQDEMTEQLNFPVRDTVIPPTDPPHEAPVHNEFLPPAPESVEGRISLEEIHYLVEVLRSQLTELSATRTLLDEEKRAIEQEKITLQQSRGTLEMEKTVLAGDRLILEKIRVEVEQQRKDSIKKLREVMDEKLALAWQKGELQILKQLLESQREELAEQKRTLTEDSQRVLRKEWDLEQAIKELADVEQQKQQVQKERDALRLERLDLEDEKETLESEREEFETARDEFEAEQVELEVDVREDEDHLPSVVDELEGEDEVENLEIIETNDVQQTIAIPVIPSLQLHAALPKDLKDAQEQCAGMRKKLVQCLNNLDRTREFAMDTFEATRRLLSQAKAATINQQQLGIAITQYFPKREAVMCFDRTREFVINLQQRNQLAQDLNVIAEAWEGQQAIINVKLEQEQRERHQQEKTGNKSKKKKDEDVAIERLPNVFTNTKELCRQISIEQPAEIDGIPCSDDEFFAHLQKAINLIEGFSF
jgi:hypothetical protein